MIHVTIDGENYWVNTTEKFWRENTGRYLEDCGHKVQQISEVTHCILDASTKIWDDGELSDYLEPGDR